MKTKIFLFFFVLCNVICLSCSEDEDVTTNLENNEYIALKPDESLFRNKDNIQKLIIAKRRFDEFVYLDENDKYQVKLENGKSINISNDLFSFLKETLSSRNKKFEDEYKLGRSQARFAWRDPYAVYVVGSLKGIWREYIDVPAEQCREIIDECLRYLQGCILIVAHVVQNTIMKEMILDETIVPDIAFTGYMPQYGVEFRSQYLPDGIYPHPTNFYRYIAIINGIGREYPFVSSGSFFVWRRGFGSAPRFYSREHASLVHDWDYAWGYEGMIN